MLYVASREGLRWLEELVETGWFGSLSCVLVELHTFPVLEESVADAITRVVHAAHAQHAQAAGVMRDPLAVQLCPDLPRQALAVRHVLASVRAHIQDGDAVCIMGSCA